MAGERAVNSERLPLAIGRMGTRAAGQSREGVPTADAKRAMTLARRVAKQLALDGGPHVIREMQSERLGDMTPQVRRSIEMPVRVVLEGFLRQPKTIADRRWAVVPFVGRRPVGATSVLCLTLHRAPHLIRALEHRFEAIPLKRIRGVQSEPQDRYPIVGITHPRRAAVWTACPLSRRPHESILRPRSDVDDHVMRDVIDRLLPLAGMTRDRFERVLTHLAPDAGRGRPWSLPLSQRALIACIALRTNLTLRELAALFMTSTSTVHRVMVAITPRLAACAATVNRDRRWAWVVDGTLIPTRDHRCAAKSKNYRWSCNAQILVRRHDLLVIATTAGGPGNRNDPVHYRGSTVQAWCQRHGHVLADGGYRGVAELVTPRFKGNRIVRDHRWRRHRRHRARVEHAIARLKNWRVLRDHRRRGCHLPATLAAVAFLHNLQVDLRNNP